MKCAGADRWKLSLINFLLRVLAIGMEHWLVFIYLPAMPLDAVPKILRGRRKRLKWSSFLLRRLLERMRTCGGSSCLISKTLSGSGTIDSRITLSHIELSLAARKRMFHGCRELSVFFDPSTYGGRSWNLGMLAKTGVDGAPDCACDLVPKVLLVAICGLHCLLIVDLVFRIRFCTTLSCGLSFLSSVK